jgi:hypothetical protein
MVTVAEVEALREELAAAKNAHARAVARGVERLDALNESQAKVAALVGRDLTSQRIHKSAAIRLQAQLATLERVVAVTEDALRAAHELICEYAGGEIDPRYAAGNEAAYLAAREALSREAAAPEAAWAEQYAKERAEIDPGILQSRLKNAPVVERPEGDDLEIQAYDRLHAHGFVKPPLTQRQINAQENDE